MRTTLTFGMAATALLLGSIAVKAQQRGGVIAACRADIAAHCGDARGDRRKMRACMIDNRDRLSTACRDAIREQRDGPGAGAMPTTTISYGNDARQAIDFYRSKQGASAPLIVFIHGGGWSMGDKRQASGEKPAHFTAGGYAFASINYRLVPAATVEQQAADIASAIDTLRYRAADLGIDADRIALMGHSAGAHLAALVATDPNYLKAADVPMAAVKAVILLDGAGYDVARQMTSDGPLARQIYQAAFGDDPQRQARLSPLRHAAAPNAASWLALHVAERAASAQQSEALVLALRDSGAEAEALPIANSSHRDLNQNLGKAGDPATDLVDAFLRQAL
jgi:acetyl esterase/lipase